MIRFVDVGRFEETFAKMISHFHLDAGLSFEHITGRIIESDYFDFLEKNDWDALERYDDKSFQAMLREMFGFEFNRELLDDVGALYWAGEAYIKVFLNYRIPLKQLFLLCPLSKMVQYFSPFHEMSFISFCAHFLQNDYRESILKTIRKSRGYTLAELSLLTRISLATLRYYEQDNERLFKASSDHVSTLSRVLNVDPSLLRRLSYFRPMSRFLFAEPDFSKEFLGRLLDYYDLPQTDRLAIKNQSEGKEEGLYIGQRNILVLGKKRISVPDGVVENLVNQCVLEDKKQERLLY